VRPVLVNGAAGAVITTDDRPVSVLGFTVAGKRIIAIDVMADPRRLALLDLARLDPARLDATSLN
jgi:RNA polymerase sigma-70 factor (ECF subfamily)